jgi:hypothetical protein
MFTRRDLEENCPTKTKGDFLREIYAIQDANGLGTIRSSGGILVTDYPDIPVLKEDYKTAGVNKKTDKQ